MAFSPEQTQFLVPKLSSDSSPFSIALLRQQSALANVHTGDRDPYDPFSAVVDQSGGSLPTQFSSVGGTGTQSNLFGASSSTSEVAFGSSNPLASNIGAAPVIAQNNNTDAASSAATPESGRFYTPEAPGSTTPSVLAPSNNAAAPSLAPFTGGSLSPQADIPAPVAPPTLATIAAIGDEDGAIVIDIDAANTGAGETLSVTIDNIPEGAVLNAGTLNPDGSVTLTPAELTGLTLTPPADFSGSFDLAITATSTNGTNTAIATDILSVTVDAVADTPDLAVTNANAGEDTPIALDVTATSPDTVSVTFAGVPDGAVLSAGTDNGDGTWTVDAGDLAGLTLTPPTDFNGSFDLAVTATASDGTDTAIATDTLSVTVDAVADAPVLTVTNTSGAEDTPIALDVTATSPDTVSVTFAGVPEGAVLSAGTDNGDGTWTVDAADLVGLTLTPPADFSGT
ncbi:hypothetical protein, partial [Thalassospira mesophila]